MFGAILMATKSSFQKGMIFCRSIYVKKVMKLLAFIFEQPSYLARINASCSRTQCIDTGEAQACGPLVLSQALYH